MLEQRVLRKHYNTLLFDFMDDPARAKRAWNRLKKSENGAQYKHYLGLQYMRYVSDAATIQSKKNKKTVLFYEFAKAKNRTPDDQLELASTVYNTFFMLVSYHFVPSDDVDTGIIMPEVRRNDEPPYTTIVLPKRRMTALIKWLEEESAEYIDAQNKYSCFLALSATSPSKGKAYLADLKQLESWPLVNTCMRWWYESTINTVAGMTNTKPDQVANIGKDTGERTTRDSDGNIREAQNKRTPEQFKLCVAFLMNRINNVLEFPETLPADLDIKMPDRKIDEGTGCEVYDLKQSRMEKLFLLIEREYKGIYDPVVGWKTETTYQPIDTFTNALHNTVFEDATEQTLTLSKKHKTTLSITPNAKAGTPAASPWDNHAPIKFDRFDRAVLRTVSSIYELAMEKDPDTLPAITVNEIYRNMTGRDDADNADKLFDEIRNSMTRYLSYARLDPDAYRKAFPNSDDRLPENLAYIYEHLIDWKPAELRSDTGTLVPAFLITRRPLPKVTADATGQLTAFPTEQLAIKVTRRLKDTGGRDAIKWYGAIDGSDGSYERMSREKIAIVDYLRTYINIVKRERTKKKRAKDDARFRWSDTINIEALIRECDIDMPDEASAARHKRKRVRDWVYKVLDSWQYDAVIWGYSIHTTKGKDNEIQIYLSNPAKSRKSKNV